MIVYQKSPYNAAPEPEVLKDSFITPVEHFFVRNHGNIPQVDSENYRLIVDGLVPNPLSLSLDQLKRDFLNITWINTIHCAGNRRIELNKVKPIEGEIPWSVNAIGNAQWRGVELWGILKRAGLDIDDIYREWYRNKVVTGLHVVFEGMDEVIQEGRNIGYMCSLPLEIAMSPSAAIAPLLLAHTMNDKPLPSEHGYPLRAIVPDHYGARSVKWLKRITIQDKPSDHYFQQREYKQFPPNMTADTADWENTPALGRVKANSAILSPQDGARLPSGEITVHAYTAWAWGEHKLRGVEFSIDGGETWEKAKLSRLTGNSGTSYTCWLLWQHTFTLEAGEHEIIVVAYSNEDKLQPEHLADVWNFKGYANNAWHRIKITCM